MELLVRKQPEKGESMKSTARKFLAGSTLLVALAITIRLAAQERHEQSKTQLLYIVKDLGTLGGSGSVAEGISDRSWVVGSANLAGDQTDHAYLWRDGVMTDLGTLGGLNSSEQWPVKDDRGLIAGVAETSEADPLGENFCGFGTGLICLGFLWENGVMTSLPTLGGNNSYAAGVNNRGQAVGWAENTTQDPTCIPPQVLDSEAVIWGPKAGQIRQLPPLPGDTISAAIGINDHEQVIGVSGLCSDPTPRAVLWQAGTVTDLGNLGGILNTTPWAINSRGFVVGQSDLAGDNTVHAFAWTKDDGIQDIGTLPGDSVSLAFGTNDKRQVVGGSCVDITLSRCRAFLWRNGVMVDVNSLVPAGSTPLYLFFGNDINSRGEIAAYAFDKSNGEFHAAVAIPCDEQHTRVEGCENRASAQSVMPTTSARPKVALTDGVSKQILKRLGINRFGPGAMGRR